ncbi:hypothetical protein AVEN_249616-1 [Araneus ventricosus]|uniref:Uncharacterized protein n=1 Tax=Araneus ventricosus TaxID=182803 RepID=A0A4Y2WL89_ARAVE|nr:hypothetical protein AVEN_183091-1 [Araneus ventricosus]GBO37979.1 hypothetical protein AVEN_142880-1 [Araneus ventricosus]GBO38227.1 hypothetical protein AVEN_180822-1 [Araneus ventricosus]GBO39176.1 hypothetical protein AVEN_249616-1 [Araneus ventricosus]
MIPVYQSKLNPSFLLVYYHKSQPFHVQSVLLDYLKKGYGLSVKGCCISNEYVDCTFHWNADLNGITVLDETEEESSPVRDMLNGDHQQKEWVVDPEQMVDFAFSENIYFYKTLALTHPVSAKTISFFTKGFNNYKIFRIHNPNYFQRVGVLLSRPLRKIQENVLEIDSLLAA